MSSAIVRTFMAALILPGTLLLGADLSSYRGFVFGSDLAAVAKQAGLKPSDAKVIHTRPARIEQLEWQPSSPNVKAPSKPDPVKDGLLSFLDGQLYRMVISYDRYRTAGMTPEDLVEAISVTYGTATMPREEIPFHSYYAEVAPVLARWEDREYSLNLIRTGDQTSFALVFYSKRLEEAAQKVAVESARLDEIDAPRKAQDVERRREAEDRLVKEKARAENKPNFRP